MKILKSGPEVRVVRHAHKDFVTGGLRSEGEEYSKEVGRRDFFGKKINRIISSSSGRVKHTIGYINENAGKPLLNSQIDVKDYLGLDGMNQKFLGEFKEREMVYEKDVTYMSGISEQVKNEGIEGEDYIENRKKEIIQDQVAQDFLNGKFDIPDEIAGAIYFKRLSQFLRFYERGRFDKNEHPPMVLSGTHQTVNEAVLRGLFGDTLPNKWRTPVGYAERVSYQPLTIEHKEKEKNVLKIEFREHTEYVSFQKIHALSPS